MPNVLNYNKQWTLSIFDKEKVKTIFKIVFDKVQTYFVLFIVDSSVGLLFVPPS